VLLLLTARGDDVDRIVGLEIGADDYLPKPFNPRELLAQTRAGDMLNR
jgi:DNA-binding response OmpR family regulator